MGKKGNKTRFNAGDITRKTNSRTLISNEITKKTLRNSSNAVPFKNLKRLKAVLGKEVCSGGAPLELAAARTKQAGGERQPAVKKSLAEEAKERLQSAQFRYLNEQLYTTTSYRAQELFQEDPHSFQVYHKGFQNQVAKWPVNPLDLIINELRRKSKQCVVADFGCGEARLALSLPDHTVHSFDLVAANERVTACDMAHVPLANRTVDVAVFCLSLMGRNIQEFLTEANRVLKTGGLLYLAEVQSRCPDVEAFLRSTEKFGFRLEKTTPEQEKAQKKNGRFFFFARFTKTSNISPKATLPRMHLKPCLYKKR